MKTVLPFSLPVESDNKHVHYTLGPDATPEDYLRYVTVEELGIFENIEKRGVLHWEYFHMFSGFGEQNFPDVFVGFMTTNPILPNGISPRAIISITMPNGERSQEIVYGNPKNFSTKKGLNIFIGDNCYIKTINQEGEYEEGNPIDLEIFIKGKKLELKVESIGKIRPAKGGTGGTTYGDNGVKLNWIQKQTSSVVNGVLKIDGEEIPISNAIGHADSGSAKSREALMQENNWDWSVLEFGPFNIVESTATANRRNGNERRKRIILAYNNQIIAEDPRLYHPSKDYEEPMSGRTDNYYSRTLCGRYFYGEKDVFEWEAREELPLLVQADFTSLLSNNSVINGVARFLNNTGIFYSGRYDRFLVKGVLRHFQKGEGGWRLVQAYEGGGIRERFLPKQQFLK